MKMERELESRHLLEEVGRLRLLLRDAQAQVGKTLGLFGAPHSCVSNTEPCPRVSRRKPLEPVRGLARCVVTNTSADRKDSRFVRSPSLMCVKHGTVPIPVGLVYNPSSPLTPRQAYTYGVVVCKADATPPLLAGLQGRRTARSSSAHFV